MSTAGRIQVLLVALALAACIVGALFLLLREPPRGSPAVEHERVASPDPAPPRPEPLERVPGEREATAETRPIGASEPYPSLGAIRGEVHVRDGASLPQRWSLVLEPHPWLQGHESAASRRRDFENGESRFEELDLPMGGYLVRAEASSLNCLPASVLLVRGSTDAFVTLLLTPGGFIDGGVLDFEGRPAEGLDVTLESVETHQRSTLSTDPAGTFLFRDVLDGEYALLFGRPDAPLLPPDSLVFKAPTLRFPTRTLPPTGTLKIRVIDESLRPVAQVRISGSAPRASAIDLFTDSQGGALVRYLLPGRYRVDAQAEDGLEASAAVDVDAGREVPLEMLVRKRKRSG